MEAIGTADFEFYNGLLAQLAGAASQGSEINLRDLNFMLAAVKSIKPKDELEAMAGAQMAAVHVSAMESARQLAYATGPMEREFAQRAFIKLTRTFTMQMEALKRYRTSGEQKVTVQHVSVTGGQTAIVGSMTQAAGNTVAKQASDNTPALTDPRHAAMPIIEQREPAPLAVRRRPKDGGRSSS